MQLDTWYEKGISKEAYMERLDKHREAFHYIYNKFSIPVEDVELFHQTNDIRVIALAAEWCGHCMLDIPILLRICEQANLPIRFLIRDDNLELMDQYLTDEKRYIPIFIFVDRNGKELAKWGPMAPAINDYVNELKTKLPEKEDPTYEEAFAEYIKIVGENFERNESLWNKVYEDLKKTIMAIN